MELNVPPSVQDNWTLFLGRTNLKTVLLAGSKILLLREIRCQPIQCRNGRLKLLLNYITYEELVKQRNCSLPQLRLLSCWICRSSERRFLHLRAHCPSSEGCCRSWNSAPVPAAACTAPAAGSNPAGGRGKLWCFTKNSNILGSSQLPGLSINYRRKHCETNIMVQNMRSVAEVVP